MTRSPNLWIMLEIYPLIVGSHFADSQQGNRIYNNSSSLVWGIKLQVTVLIKSITAEIDQRGWMLTQMDIKAVADLLIWTELLKL